MSERVEGTVEKLSAKDTSNGGKVYNILVDCHDNEDDAEWFGLGFEQPDFGEGDVIEFDVVTKGKYTNAENVEVIEDNGGSSKSSGRGGRSSGGRGSRSSGGSSRSGGNSSRSGGSSRSSGGSSRSGGRSSGGTGRGGSKGTGGRSKAAGGGAANSKDQYWKDKEQRDITTGEYIRRQSCMNTSIALAAVLMNNDALALPAKKADKADALIAFVEEYAEDLYTMYGEQVLGADKPTRSGGGRDEDDEDQIPE